MTNLFLAVVIIGLSGLVAQALILRELLVSFYGNELTLGIVLANWIICEAAGVFFIGKLIERIKKKIDVFIILQIIFSISLIPSVFLAKTFKHLIGIPFGEAIGLSVIFNSCLFINLVLSFCHGALFSVACKLYSLENRDSVSSIGKVYSWETSGTILGGIVFTYLFLPFFNSFQIAALVSLLNLLICLIFFTKSSKTTKYATLFVFLALVFFISSKGLQLIRTVSLTKQWAGQKVFAEHNSVYGNVVVTKKEEQYTFFYNGLPVIITPYPDKQFVEDFGNLPLLFHESPRNALVISSAAGGLLNEMIKHPLSKIDYVEIDPLIIKMLKKFPTKLIDSEIYHPKVNIVNTDGRYFLRINTKIYDVVLIGLSNQSDLSTNRIFTKEFFSLVKSRLSPKGIFAIWMPGSLTYLSGELIDLNYCILNTLKTDFEFVRVIPGDYNIFLASPDNDIISMPSSLISKRIGERHIETALLKPAYLDYRLSKYWSDWFWKAKPASTDKINRDLHPVAVYDSLLLWNKKFSPKIKAVLEFFGNLNLKWILAGIIFLTLLLFLIIKRSGNGKIPLVYAIASTGFFAMLANLILIFSFQTFYGYLYQKIGLLISIFMAGIAVGSFVTTKRITKIKDSLNYFILLEGLIIVFSFLMALILSRLYWIWHYSHAIFIVLFFICGLLAGLEFPLAGKIYLRGGQRIGEVSGILYSADLLGGWLAGILGGVVLLPVIGLFNTCLAIIMFKVSSIILLVSSKKRLTKSPI